MDKAKTDKAPNPFEALVEVIREAVRQELQPLISQNGHKDDPLLLSAKAAGKRYDINESWFSNMARQNKIPYVRLGHYVRFRPDDLEEFIKEHKEPKKPE